VSVQLFVGKVVHLLGCKPKLLQPGFKHICEPSNFAHILLQSFHCPRQVGKLIHL